MNRFLKTFGIVVAGIGALGLTYGGLLAAQLWRERRANGGTTTTETLSDWAARHASTEQLTLLKLVSEHGWPVGDASQFIKVDTEAGLPYLVFNIGGKSVRIEFSPDGRTFTVTSNHSSAVNPIIGPNPTFESFLKEANS